MARETYSFDAIEYLSGLTSFVFDEATLKRVASENELHYIKKYDDLDEEIKDKCLISLLECVLDGPWSTASQKNRHGDFEVQIGQQTITAATIENIKRRLRALYRKYDMDDYANALEVGEVKFIDEGMFA